MKTNTTPGDCQRILITGGAGFLGTQVANHLASFAGQYDVLATDVRIPNPGDPNYVEGVQYRAVDIRDRDAVFASVSEHKCDAVIHLAAMVTPPPGWTREMMYEVDVTGTQHILDACVAAECNRVVVTSSGAAYGYYEDNAEWLTESDPIRGNFEFPYSHHKRVVEEMLADYRQSQPQLTQMILRVGTILGLTVRNQITNLFDKKRMVGVSGCDSPFVFIWDTDLVEIIRLATAREEGGIFNIAGDGAVGMPDIAARMGKPYLALPSWLIKAALAIAHPLKLSRYGPEQVRFLQYRPVLDNGHLKSAFPYTPQKTSAEALDTYLAHVGLLNNAG